MGAGIASWGVGGRAQPVGPAPSDLSTRPTGTSPAGGAARQPNAKPPSAPDDGAARQSLTSAFSNATPGGPLPAGWLEQRLRSIDANRYRLVAEQGQTMLKIESNRSASSVLHRLPPGARPARLAWRWRTDNWPSASAAFGEKAGDDFSLRLYLMFDYPLDRVPTGQALALRMARALHDPTLPAATLCYVADPRVPAGKLMASPYTSRVQVMVIRSAPLSEAGWQEDRDLEADFQRAFGSEYGPGMAPVAAVALAADTDQSGSRVNSWFSDLRWSNVR
ncbi:MAG: DUF3047 domain-containing protein [Burkholderiaceae bacterium]|nr:DUF3047 domain-containing protein [Burkholderiaceae bacterium]MBP7659771.1 DUF3047 domain-containing protein [Burkholderiaceae bacterium]